MQTPEGQEACLCAERGTVVLTREAEKNAPLQRLLEHGGGSTAGAGASAPLQISTICLPCVAQLPSAEGIRELVDALRYHGLTGSAFASVVLTSPEVRFNTMLLVIAKLFMSCRPPRFSWMPGQKRHSLSYL